MIDLHSPLTTVADYARRYDALLPSPTVRTGDGTLIKPDWLRDPHCPSPPAQALDSAQGALLGLAVADALHAAVQSRPAHDSDSSQPHPGNWTAATSMALCLADTYLEHGRFDHAGFADALVRWYRQGENSCTGRHAGMGNTLRLALEGWDRNRSTLHLSEDPLTAGNGSLVRLAPTAIFRRHSRSAVWRESATQSKVTHKALEAVNGCQLFAWQLHAALNGADKAAVCAPQVLPLYPRTLVINAGEYKHKGRHAVRASGYVIDTLEMALWVVWNTHDFRGAVSLAASLGSEASGVAATVGQLAGALYGLSGIPADWLARVAWSSSLPALAHRLFECAPVAEEADALIFAAASRGGGA